MLNQLVYMDKWLSVTQVKKYCLSDRCAVTIRNMLNHLVELKLVDRRSNKNQLYQRYLYRAKPELYKTDLSLAAMVDGYDMREASGYTEAAIINKFRQMAHSERQSVILSSSELQKMIKSDQCGETIRLKLKSIANKGYIKPRLVGRIYEYDLDLPRLLNTRTPEVINAQGDELTELFVAHRLHHNNDQVTQKTQNSWNQTFKRMLEEGYEFATIKHIIAYLSYSPHYLEVVKSPSNISSLYETLYEEAQKTLSIRKAKRYLYRLTHALIPRIQTGDNVWNNIEEWMAKIQGKLRYWYYKSNYGAHGVEFGDYLMQARFIMHKFITTPPESEGSRRHPNNWLHYRLNDFIDKRRLKNEDIVILNESDLIRDGDDERNIIDQFAAPEREESAASLPSQFAQKVHEALAILTDRERELVIDLFDFDNGEHNQADFGKKHGLSASWVSELRKKAMSKLQRYFEAVFTADERLELTAFLSGRHPPPDSQ